MDKIKLLNTKQISFGPRSIHHLSKLKCTPLSYLMKFNDVEGTSSPKQKRITTKVKDPPLM